MTINRTIKSAKLAVFSSDKEAVAAFKKAEKDSARASTRLERLREQLTEAVQTEKATDGFTA